MKHLLPFFVLLSYLQNALAQEKTCQAFYPNQSIAVEATLPYLNEFFKEEKGNTSFELLHKTESLTSFHYLYQQTLDGLPIQHADVKINITKQGKVISIYSNLVNPTIFSNRETVATSVLDNAFVKWKAEHAAVKTIQKTMLWLPEETVLKQALHISYQEQRGMSKEVWLNETGTHNERITATFFAQDSTVSGMVFNPDPLTTAGVVYGGSYQDFNDSNVTELNNQRQSKTFKASFDGSTFRLKSPYIELKDLDNDNLLPVTSATPVFNYKRYDFGFEDVNAFYHLSTHNNYIRQLGFHSADSLIYADPHGNSGDNSFFVTPNTLYFGIGGVDDAEDADVIVHEYTHSVSYNASPGTNSGQTRMSIDEGTCDYFAAAYSKALNAYHWEWVYNWDGHNPFWSGRVVSTTKHYPQNLNGNIYKDGEMWSSTLMNIHDELGRATTDSLALETMYLFASGMSYPQVAQALLQADTLLTGGRNYCVIYKYLFLRGYLPFVINTCGIINDIAEISALPVELLNTPNGFVIRSNDAAVEIKSFEIINSIGQGIQQTNGFIFENKMDYTSGIYFVKVNTNKGSITLKMFF